MGTTSDIADVEIVTLAGLAEAGGVTVQALGEWQRLGLLAGPGDRVEPMDLERVRLILFLERRGISPETIASVCATHGDLVGIHVDMLFPGRRSRIGRSLDEAARTIGLDLDVLGRLWEAAGLGGQGEVYEEDMEALRGLLVALDAGLPVAALVQVLRVYSDALGRVAEAEARLFHHYVHEGLRAQGIDGAELTAATEAVAEPLVGLMEPTVAYFHRKAWERSQREDLLVHMVQDAAPPGDVPGEIAATILFVDLSGFTPLTEAMGDAAAAALMERFSGLVRRAALEHNGTVVKQIGDEFMLAFTEPAAAVACGLDIEAAASAEEQFPAVRQGAHAGRVLYRVGDYVGSTVNVAARVVAEADRHQFLITGAVRDGAGDRGDATFSGAGTRSLRGIAERVELFEVVPTSARPARAIDPVCLMELDPSTCLTQLTWRGAQVHFCSEACLARFVAAPDQYSHDPK